jgi:hypothetical protein
MKEHNPLVRFKNSSIADASRHEGLTAILSEDLPTVIEEKLRAVAVLYRSQAAENGYSPALAYRVIILHLLGPAPQGFDLKEEVLRFFKHSLGRGELEDLRMCYDFLLLKELPLALAAETVRLLKARVLQGMREYYRQSNQGTEKRKCAYMLQEYCKDALRREEVKRNPEVYSEVLDILIGEVKRKVSSFLKRKDRIHAL